MGADAQRIGELGQEGVEAGGEIARQRLQRRRPRRIVAREFRVQRQRPGPAIGAFEPGAHRAGEIGAFARDIGGREHRVGAGADGGRLRHVGIEPHQLHHLPPAMDAAVPVETAVEDRVMRAWGPGVLRPGQHQIHLEGIFAAEMRQGEAGEAAGDIGGEQGHGKASQ